MAQVLPPSFWAKVNKTDTCWLWTAAKVRSGYGAAYVNRRQRPAHRLAYEAVYGSVPDHLDMDNLCRVRACVNPDHLEPVTRQVNLLRSPLTLTSQKAAQTECVHGHEYTPENTIVRENGTRTCRECSRIRRRAYVARRKVA